jgi:serine phosphatase RsbU (regulator of sigma subunit)
MGMLKTSSRTQLLDERSPTAIFERLNRVLPAVKENHMYTTCTAVRVLPVNSHGTVAVEYAIAVQPPILHFHADTGSVSRLCDEQLPIGLFTRSGLPQSQCAGTAERLAANCDRWNSRRGK